jgi:hypothetical protein
VLIDIFSWEEQTASASRRQQAFRKLCGERLFRTPALRAFFGEPIITSGFRESVTEFASQEIVLLCKMKASPQSQFRGVAAEG